MGGAGGVVEAAPVKKKQEPKCKLKQVHWVKVNDRKLKGTIWEKMQDESVNIDKNEIEALFAMKESGKIAIKAGKETNEDEEVGPNGQRKKRVVILLSANRSQTIGVLLSHLKVPHEEFRKAIMTLDTRTLQPNFVIQLMRLLPTDQEVAALQSYTGPKEELGTAERFLFELLCIPRLKSRLQCFVFILEFNARLHDLSENVEVVTYALHDIKRCVKLSQVFEILLAMGNYLNGTGPRGGAWGFKLEVLAKLSDTKTTDGKSTLLHYLAKFISNKHKDLIDFPSELSNVEIGSKVSENMVDEISKFKKEVKFIYEEMNRPYYKSNAKNDPCGAKLEQFYHTAYNDMEVLDQNKKEALAMYKEVSTMFGEADLKPDEFLTQIHQFATAFKEACNENERKREEEERIAARRAAFIKQMADRDAAVEARKAKRLGAGKTPDMMETSAAAKAAAARGIDVAPNKAAPSAVVNKAGLKAAPGTAMKRESTDKGGSERSSVASGGGGDVSISDMISDMPKSGKFVIKKAAAGSGNNLLRDHLQRKDTNAGAAEGPAESAPKKASLAGLKDFGRFLSASPGSGSKK